LAFVVLLPLEPTATIAEPAFCNAGGVARGLLPAM
jgi:hypothetical protein